MNLLVNASDALGDRGGTITVVTRAQQMTTADLAAFPHGETLPAGPYVELQVADTGIGMDATTLARIFDPFFTTKFTGRGLGLAAVIGIVRGHRGALRVASTPGVGTTFTIVLPASPGAVLTAVVDTAAPPVAMPTRTVLVVDDDDGVRRLATRALSRAGHRVLEARGYDEQDATGPFDAGGAAAFVQKPYRASELVTRLESLLPR